MQSHQIPNCPWSKIATDLFTLNSKNYITVVDYFSDFIEPIVKAAGHYFHVSHIGPERPFKQTWYPGYSGFRQWIPVQQPRIS